MEMQQIDTIYANGGFAKSEVWVQMLADIFGKKVVLNETVETGAAGAAMMGLKALGIYKSYSELKAFTEIGKTFKPDPKAYKIYQDISERFVKGARLLLSNVG